MGDALSDFFAKKDRKKKLGNKSNLDSKLDRNENESKVKKEKNLTDGFKYIQESNEEWHDFEENKEKDYSGLKIQVLSLKDKEQVMNEQKIAESLAEEPKDDMSKAWSSKVSGQDVIKTVEKVEEINPLTGAPKRYVPPTMRSSTSDIPKKSNKKAPEIANKMEFPTLGG